MELKQYVADAIRTESVINVVTVDPTLLSAIIKIIIASGKMLDNIKKHVFYNRPLDVKVLRDEFVFIIAALDELKPVITHTENNIDPQDTAYNPRIFHAVIGIVTEAVELLEGLHSEDFDKVNFLEELGDLNWYEAIGIDAVNGDFDEVLTTNIEKLRARYPEKFDNTAAVKRDLEAERAVLDSGLNDDNSGDRGC